MKLALKTAVGISLTMSLFSPCWASGEQCDELTRAAVAQYKQGLLDEAVALEQKALARNGKRWLPHATLAYLNWQQGDVVSAQQEAQVAVKLAPRNTTALINLAAICEAQDDCATALPLYERACKIDPVPSSSWLGRVRCNSKIGRSADALSVLGEMSNQKRDDFDWHWQLARVSLSLEQFQVAQQAASRAMSLAATPEQKCDAGEQRMLALLMDKRLDDARAMQSEFFTECASKDYEVYVRAAQSLLSGSDLQPANQLLTAAIKNLNDFEDSEGFYRLGRIFQCKGANSQWADKAEASFRRALQLNPHMGKYHVALAAVLDDQKKPAAAAAELNAAVKLNSSDLLAKFLSEKGAGMSSLGLTRVEFQVNGLNCACHVGKLAQGMRDAGVALVDISAIAPYRGCVLIDERSCSLEDSLMAARQKAFVGMKDSFGNVTFGDVRRSPCSTMLQAVVTFQDAADGDVLRFTHAFAGVQPSMPVEATAAASPQL